MLRRRATRGEDEQLTRPPTDDPEEGFSLREPDAAPDVVQVAAPTAARPPDDSVVVTDRDGSAPDPVTVVDEDPVVDPEPEPVAVTTPAERSDTAPVTPSRGDFEAGRIDAVEWLRSALDAQRSEVATFTSTLARHLDALAGVRDLGDRVAALEARLDDLGSQLHALAAGIHSVVDSTSGLGTTLDVARGRLDALAEGAAHTPVALEELEHRLSAIEARLGTPVGAGTDADLGWARDAAESVAANTTAVASLARHVNELTEKLIEAEERWEAGAPRRRERPLRATRDDD